jgi:NTP pyrophosphatase (non-canonical NTP hydrolase)
MDIKSIQQKLEEFANERDWNQFHTPKNLSMAISVEAAELQEIFQWLTESESIAITNSENKMALIKEEIADIFLYLVRISDKLGIDIEDAALNKIKVNALKYPVDISKGNADKYNRRDK